jgi:hypothetical protein
MRRKREGQLHPLVREAMKSLGDDDRALARRTVQDGLQRTPRGVLEMAVTQEMAQRAGQVLDRFIGVVEGPGIRGKVYVSERGDSFVQVDGVDVRFKLKQELHWAPHQPNREEKKQIARSGWGGVPRADWAPGPGLALEFWMPSSVGKAKAVIKDSPRATVEEKLGKVGGVLTRLVAEEREEAARTAATQAALAEAERQGMAKRMEETRRKELLADVLEDARRWHEARLLRDFLAQVEVSLSAQEIGPNHPGADRLNELKAAVHSFVMLTDRTWPGVSLPVA